MKDSKVLGCISFLVLLGATVICVSSINIGKAGIGFTLIAAIIGFIIGSAIGASIGVVGGGGGSNGAALLGILFAVVFGLAANSGVLSVTSWWTSNFSNTNEDEVLTITSTPSLVDENNISSISYDEIEGNYEKMSRNEWQQYKSKLIGKRFKWLGIVDRKSDNSINLYLGQNKLTRRIYLSDLSPDIIDSLSEHQKIEFEGTLYEISQILGLNLYLTDIDLIDPVGETKPN